MKTNETKTYKLAPGVNADRLAICLRKHGFLAFVEGAELRTTANATVINLAFGRSTWRVISNIWN